MMFPDTAPAFAHHPLSLLQPQPAHAHAHPPPARTHAHGHTHTNGGYAPAGPADAQRPDAPPARRPATRAIGAPHRVPAGPLAGRTIRAVLEEVQKADLGRKCADPPRPAHVPALLHEVPAPGADRARPARKDRRPLDPPPVVALRLFEVFHAGTPREAEHRIPADEIDINGFIGHADLFPYPYPPDAADDPPPPRRKRPSPAAGSPHTSPPAHAAFTFSIPPAAGDVADVRAAAAGARAGTAALPRLAPPQVREESKLTTSLFGTSYAHAVSMLDMRGEKVIYFVFSDLAVKLEGVFFLRYRFFDLAPLAPRGAHALPAVPVLAECVGGPFAVYSTKEFPGLRASTELTKHLSRWGIRVNIRETERRRRPAAKKAPAADAGGSGGVLAGGRKRKAYDDGEDEGSDGGSEYDDE